MLMIWDWLTANVGTIIVLGLVSGMVVGLILGMIRDKKRGKSCCGGCSGCSMAGECHGGSGDSSQEKK